MDIDAAAFQLPRQVVAQDLHVARQHHQVGLVFADQVEELRFLGRLVGLVDRQTDIGNAVPLDEGAHVVMVGHDAGDIDRQQARAPAVQQFVQAVAELRHGDQHLGLGAEVEDFPLHGEPMGDRLEAVAQRVHRRHLRTGLLEHHADIEHVAQRVVELVRLDDRNIVVVKITRHGRDNAAGIRALDDQDIDGRIEFGRVEHEEKLCKERAVAYTSPAPKRERFQRKLERNPIKVAATFGFADLRFG